MKKSNLSSQTPKRQRKQLLGTLCLLAILSPTPVLADTMDALADSASNSLIKAIDKLREEMSGQFDSLGTRLQKLFSDAADALTARAQQSNIALLNPSGAYGFVGESKGGAKPVYDLVRDAVQTSVSTKLQTALAPGDETTQNNRNQVLLQLPPSTDAASQMMDMQSLLGPLSYTPTQQNQAERTIAFFSNYSSPLGSIDLAKLQANPTLANGPGGQAYKVKVYSQAALRSLLLGNLYKSFNARVPVAGLGTVSGMQSKDASLAEVEKYTASRRISDPQWYTDMNTAPPIAVNREAVFILAQILWELHQMRMENETMLQTMTAIGITSAKSSAAFPERSEIELKSALDGTNPTAADATGELDPSNLPSGAEQTAGGVPSAPID